ncbi:MAG: exo-alpha-sialidase [Acidobacteriota bacterium]
MAAPRVVKHVEVCRSAGRFAGWPANHGAWRWGDEILVGFELGWLHHNSGHNHAIDYDRPAEHLLARSLDGGESWAIERNEALKPPPNQKIAGVPGEAGGRALAECPGGIDFTSPGFALTARMNSVDAGESRFYYTLDRGKHWEGPFRIPNFGQPGTAARTDYLVNGPHDLTMFLTAAKRNGKEGRVIAVRTDDGAKTWRMLSFVCPEPEGRDYAIMPSSVRLPGGAILTAIRYREWIDLYRSDDGPETWSYVGRPAPGTGGNPPSMVRLADGRLALTYGYRVKPFGIRARLSGDEGRSWGEEIVLREDGGNWDLGYPRTVQRSDGKLVTAYYYNTNSQAERFIGATIWEAG